MILCLKYEDVTANAAKGEVDGKQVNFFMRIQVDEMNIAEAVERFRGNKLVAALDYVGEPSFLNGLDLSGVLVLVKKEVETLDDNLDFFLSNIDPRVRVVLKLPKTYADMRTVYDFSQKYPNVRFCGGNLIRLEGCNIGCLGADDIAKKVPSSRVSTIAEGCGCIMQNIHIDDVDVVEFYEAKSQVVKKKVESASSNKSKTSSKPKKAFADLIPLSSTGSLDNF